ncbi:MAG: GIY-YIG nuclease family protein, partial [Desulfovibrionaceae bacterium]|nr:GIY-YIG nuclease family protein [Desulfovibrionaceae bacterium]
MPDQLDSFTSPKTKSRPRIYAYSDDNPRYAGLLKVGFTSRAVEERMAEHYPTKLPGSTPPYTIVFNESAMYDDGGAFTDHAVHKMLRRKGFDNEGEWFRCAVEDVRAAWLAVRNRIENEENRDQNFAMRPEQAAAVEKTMSYFQSAQSEGLSTPKFLWNAKMRFGKTFATYQLAKAMGLKRVLILTFKPAVQSAWREDLCRHIDFEGWQFISRASSELNLDEQYAGADKSRPIVCFGSFQDFLGLNKAGGIKANNEWVHTSNWDLVVFDEYHYGAWKDSAKKLFEPEDEDEPSREEKEKFDPANALNESWLPITAARYLYLSGTPFRALNSGEFIEEQIYNWTYSD